MNNQIKDLIKDIDKDDPLLDFLINEEKNNTREDNTGEDDPLLKFFDPDYKESPEHLKKIAEETSSGKYKDFEGIKTSTPEGPYRELYEKGLISPLSIDRSNWDEIGMASQSGYEVARRATMGFLQNAWAGIVSGFASNDFISSSQLLFEDTHEARGLTEAQINEIVAADKFAVKRSPEEYAKMSLQDPTRSQEEYNKISLQYPTRESFQVAQGLSDKELEEKYPSFKEKNINDELKLEKEYDNMFFRYSEEIRKEVAEEYHIFNNTDDVFTGRYIGQMAQTLGFSTGMIAEVGTEVLIANAIVAAATGGTGNVATASLMASKTLKALKIARMAATSGIWFGWKETLANALETKNNLEELANRTIEEGGLGLDRRTAERLGNDAAATHLRRESLPSMVLNAFQFGALKLAAKGIGTAAKGLRTGSKGIDAGFSGGATSIANMVLPNIKNKVGRIIKDNVLAIASESLEEGIQTGTGKLSMQSTLVENGYAKKQPWTKTVWDGSNEMRDSMIAGGVGGLLFRNIGMLISYASTYRERDARRALKAKYDDFYDTMSSTIKKDLTELKKAENDGDVEKASEIRRKMQDESVLEALRLDLIQQNDIGYTAYVDNLTKMIKASVEGDQDALTEAGLNQKEDEDLIADLIANGENYLAEAKKTKDQLIKNLKETKNNYEIALHITRLEKDQELTESRALAKKDEYEKLGSSLDKDSKELGDNYYDILSYIKEIEDSIESKEKEKKEAKGLTKDQKDALDLEIDGFKETLKEREADLAALIDNISSSNKEDGILEYVLRRAEYNQLLRTQEFIQEEINEWRTPEKRKKRIIEHAVKSIDSANTLYVLDEIGKTLDNLNAVTPEIKRKIKAKEIEIKAKDNRIGEKAFKAGKSNDTSEFEEDEDTSSPDTETAEDETKESPDDSGTSPSPEVEEVIKETETKVSEKEDIDKTIEEKKAEEEKLNQKGQSSLTKTQEKKDNLTATESEIEESEKELEELKNNKKTDDETISKLKSEKKEADKKIAELEKKDKKSKKDINDLNKIKKDSDANQKTIDDLEKANKVKDKGISEKNKKLSELNTKKEKLEKEKTDLEKSNTELSGQLKTAQKELSELKDNQSKLETEINTLKASRVSIEESTVKKAKEIKEFKEPEKPEEVKEESKEEPKEAGSYNYKVGDVIEDEKEIQEFLYGIERVLRVEPVRISNIEEYKEESDYLDPKSIKSIKITSIKSTKLEGEDEARSEYKIVIGYKKDSGYKTQKEVNEEFARTGIKHRLSTVGSTVRDVFLKEKTATDTTVNEAAPAPTLNVTAKAPVKAKDADGSFFNLSTENFEEILKALLVYEFKENAFLNPLLETLSGNDFKGLKVKLIEFKSNDAKKVAYYDTSDSTIYINEKVLGGSVISIESLGQVIAHEMVHYLTAETINRYFNKKGKLLKSYRFAPKEIQHLESLYRIAKNSKKNIEVEYDVTNLHEFVAQMMTNSDFQKKMNSVNYSSNQSLFERFIQVVTDILNSVLKKLNKNAVTYNSIKTILEIIDNKSTLKQTGKPSTKSKLNSPKDITDTAKELKKELNEDLKLLQKIQEKDTPNQKPQVIFEKVIESIATNFGEDTVKDIYKILANGWETNNPGSKINYDKVYNKIFEQTPQPIQTTAPIQETKPEDNKIEDPLSENRKGAQKSIIDNTIATITDIMRAAFLSVQMKRVIKKVTVETTEIESEKGSEKTITSYNDQDTSETLNQNDFIDSDQLLKSDVANKNTELELRIPEKLRDVKIIVYKSKDGSVREVTTFGQWEDIEGNEKYIKVNGKKQLNPRWVEKVPVIAYEKGSKNAKGLFFLHEGEWYNHTNIGSKDNVARQNSIIKSARKIITETRNSLLANKDGKLDITITDKTGGSFVFTESPTSITDANPDAFFISVDGGVLREYPSGKIFKGQLNHKINENSLRPGRLYYVVKSINDGEYVALQFRKEELSKDIKDSLLLVLESYFKEDVKNKKKDSIYSLLKNEGIDINKIQELENYLGLFIHMTKLKQGESVNKFIGDRESNDKIPDGSTYILFDKKRLYFGIKGSYNKSVSFKGSTTELSSFLDELYQNDSFLGLKENKQVYLVNAKENQEGYEINAMGEYNKFLKGKFKTNIKSFNISNNNTPVYATVVQPVIEFKPSSQVTELEKVEDVFGEKPETPKSKTPSRKDLSDEDIQNIESIKNEIAELEELNIDTSSLKEELKILETGNKLESPVRISETNQEDKNFEEALKSTFEIPGIYNNNFFEIVAAITKDLRDKIKDNEKVDQKLVLQELRKEFIDYANLKIKKLDDIINKGKKLNRPKVIMDTLEEGKETYKTVLNNWETVEKAVLERLSKMTNIKEGRMPVEGKLDDSTEIEKNWSKTSLEENGKLKISYRVKRLLDSIHDVDSDGSFKKGFLGVPLYVGFDTVIDVIESIMASPEQIDSDFNSFIQRLKDHAYIHKWLPELIEILEKEDQQVKNEFVSYFDKHTIEMNFLIWSRNKNGTYTAQSFQTDASKIGRVIREIWDSNLKRSTLTTYKSGQYTINKEKAKELISVYEKWKTIIDRLPKGRTKITDEISNAEIKNWFSDFGILLSEGTINHLKEKKLKFKSKTVGEGSLSFVDQFNINYGLFKLLSDNLKKTINESNTEYIENLQNHPTNGGAGIIKGLINLESEHSTVHKGNSIQDGGKGIFLFTNPTHGTDIIKALKNDEEFRNTLRTKPFNKHSFILDLLEGDLYFNDSFSVEHLGINAFKEMGKKLFGDNSITSLSEADHELVKLGLFQDSKQNKIETKVGKHQNIVVRMARMFYPTMSDKTQMLELNTGVLNLTSSELINEEGELKLRDDLLEFMYSQLVKPELERIVDHSANLKEGTNIKDYDNSANMFLLIPELNNIFYGKQKDEKIRATALMSLDPYNHNVEWFERELKKEAKKVISDLVLSEVNKKIEKWEQNGVFEKSKGGVFSSKFLDNKYLQKFYGASSEMKIRLAANDFVINSLITNANFHALIAGDPALYSKDNITKYFQEGKTYIPLDKYGNDVYSKISKEIGVNIGKRLAEIIAPGTRLANSKNEKYTQVFMNDAVGMASNVVTLVEMSYNNKKDIDYAKKKVSEYEKAKNENTRKGIRDALAKRFPKIEPFFNIESTDAQEYTTLSEHIRVLMGEGKLPSEVYEKIKKKIKIQQEAEALGFPIPNDALLNYNEWELALQSTKPVYVGLVDDKASNAMRMVYIKSSAFPLIPQMTQGLQMDNLRRLLEKNEMETGKSVRASYASANKVGGVKNPITPFLSDGTFDSSLTTEALRQSSLELKREDFRIQQEIPFKKNQTTVSLVTQAMKLLFGDGILNINDFTYNGEKKTGKQLKEIYDSIFDQYIIQKKRSLFKELGLDDNGNPYSKDPATVMKKLQELLISEAIKRGYPKQDIKALKLIEKKDSNGKVVGLEFNSPLWMSPNSNRYESLLNSIVTNMLVNIKLPGNAFTLVSEAGFKVKSSLVGIDQSKIIFTSKFSGELKGYENGNLTQVFLPSKFKDNNGNLIELIDKNGVPNPLYVEIGRDGRLMLIESMISPELLNIPSFRIPNSGHVSMVQAEIVGILPTEAGEVMILPKNIIQQKGLDYDADKEFTYQLHTYVDKKGKIKALTEESINEILKEKDKKSFDELNDGSPESNLIIAMFGNDPNFKEDEIEKESYIGRLRENLKERLYENELVKIHSAVLSNKSDKVQKKINKILSIEFAKKQASLIEEVKQEGIDDKYFTILSDEYQKNKMVLNASGKFGIAVYSNYSVFHSMVEQALKEKTIRLTDFDPNISKIVNFSITLGGVKSDGILGKETTLAKTDLQRPIAEVYSEKQNTATDDAKENIMGRVNVNQITIGVDSLLTGLGFDKGSLSDGREVSIPYLFLSQPIIIDYVEKIKRTNSLTKEFTGNSEEEVLKELKKEYFIKGKNERVEDDITTDTLFRNLKKENSQNDIQLLVLELFLSLDRYAKNINTLQNLLNINKSGLGKSFFETIDKYDRIENVKVWYKTKLSNVSQLIGDFVNDDGMSELKRQDYLDNGYVLFSEKLVKPNNPVGSMLIHGINTGFILWNEHFPYDDPTISEIFDSVINATTGETTSFNRKVEIKQEVFKDIKKYIFTSDNLGFHENISSLKRKELFIDDNENISLSTYLSNLVESELTKYDFIKNNRLISRFFFKLEKHGIPSLIKFDNVKGESFDEDYLYNSLIELMARKTPLPQRNGKDYNSRDLAKDLISYSYLGNPIQEAIEFNKYVPIEYLNMTNFSRLARSMQNKFNENLNAKYDEKKVSRFLKQYFQHNPGQLLKIGVKQISSPLYHGNTRDLYNLQSFSVGGYVDKFTEAQKLRLKEANFIAIYNPFMKKGLNKYQIYEKTKNRYERISTLGVFGMAEYDVNKDNVISIINTNYINEEQKRIGKGLKNDGKNIEKFSPKSLLDAFARYSFDQPYVFTLMPLLKEHIINGITFEVVNMEDSGNSPVKYDKNKKAIEVDSYFMTNKERKDVAKSVVRTIANSITISHLENIGTNEESSESSDMLLLYEETKSNLEGKEGFENDMAFKDFDSFISEISSNKAFQEIMQKTEYSTGKKGKSVFDKYTSISSDILKKAFGNQGNKITYSNIANILKVELTSIKESKSMTNNQETLNIIQEAKNRLSSPVTINPLTIEEELSSVLKCKI